MTAVESPRRERADTATYAASARVDRRSDAVSVRRLVLRFALAGLPALAAAIVVTAAASIRIGTRLGIEDAKRVNWASGQLISDVALDDSIVDLAPDAITRADRAVRAYVVRASLVRVKIWAADGQVLYSNEARLIGERFTLGAEEMRVLRGEEDAEAEVSDLRKPENRFEEPERRLLEVYRRVLTPNGTPLLFESYFRYDDVRTTGRDLWRQFGPIAVGSLLVLELVQIPFALSLARRLRAGQRQRERLLQHAIDSSDAERRRIASDLHDGAVQDLTGVSMSLAAASRKPAHETAHDVMVDAGARIRETVKSLRSMLVDIYPPNLHEEGLESALADLLGSLHNRGAATELDVSPEASALAPEVVSLLYRSAQEAIRNVVSHAAAGAVGVTVRLQGDDAVLIVEDDGRGFDPERLAERARAGHVGLRSLTGLVEDAGGTIEIRSAPGQGTRVRVTVPR